MKQLKLFALIFVSIMLASSNPDAVSAEAPIKVILDKEEQSYEQSPLLIEGTTLVPMRGIFESLGAEVTWDGTNQRITATKRNTTVELQIGVQTAKVNGTSLTLAQKPQIFNGRTLVPLRFVSEALGAEVAWKGDTRTVEIVSAEEQLYNSVWEGDWDTFEYLLGMGSVDPNGTSEDNTLSIAALVGARDPLANEMMAVLLEAGADPNYQNQIGNTALMTAAHRGNEEGVEVLLDAKANVHLKNDKGETALWQAGSEGEESIVELLRQAGDTETRFPLLADAKTEDEIVDVLKYYLSRTVIDGMYENDYGLDRTEALMFLSLSTKEQYDAFQKLSDTGKKKVIVEYVQEHWGDVLGVRHCYTILSYDMESMIGIDVNYDTTIEGAKIVYPSDGRFYFER